MLPPGHLVCLFPWAQCASTPAVPPLSSWFWSNTVFFPSFLWNLRDIVLLSVADGVQARDVRMIQVGINSQLHYTWLMENIMPLRLSANPVERATAHTIAIMSLFKREESKPSGSHPSTGVSQRNAQGEVASAAKSETTIFLKL